jgi:hypothetical protein
MAAALATAVVATVALAADLPEFGPPPPAVPSCVAQLRKDGCLPAAGTHKCADCGVAHQQDLEKAQCTEQFVLNWCEGRGTNGHFHHAVAVVAVPGY